MSNRAASFIPYVSHVLDTALSPDHSRDEIGEGTYLVAWQCGFEPMVVAVIGDYTEAVDENDAEDIALDYLKEIGWARDEFRGADYVVRVDALDVDAVRAALEDK